MKVRELQGILDGFDDEAEVEIEIADMSILAIKKVKLMMDCYTVIQPGGFIALTERDRASARPICTIVARGLNNAS